MPSSSRTTSAGRGRSGRRRTNPGGGQQRGRPGRGGGVWRVPGVRRRLTRWDGCCVYGGTPGSWGDSRMTADDVRGSVALLEQERGGRQGFDICLGGDVRLPDFGRERD